MVTQVPSGHIIIIHMDITVMLDTLAKYYLRAVQCSATQETQ
jgi:hypothetical protein